MTLIVHSSEKKIAAQPILGSTRAFVTIQISHLHVHIPSQTRGDNRAQARKTKQLTNEIKPDPFALERKKHLKSLAVTNSKPFFGALPADRASVRTCALSFAVADADVTFSTTAVELSEVRDTPKLKKSR